jgi:DNA invertase Pin-like site-specific DNA recombinase
MGTFVTYLRVSTHKQQESGLGLEAQREAVTAFAASRRSEIIAEYVEVESGGKSDRPALLAALAHAKRVKATLLIAKLDRLARSVAIVSSLMEAGVDFVAADMPEANKFVLHIIASVAEYEREQISARTKAALAAAKARGVKLGTYSAILAKRRIEEATSYASSVEFELKDVLASGARTLREIANGLNAQAVPTREGGMWWPSNTARLMSRLGIVSPA